MQFHKPRQKPDLPFQSGAGTACNAAFSEPDCSLQQCSTRYTVDREVQLVPLWHEFGTFPCGCPCNNNMHSIMLGGSFTSFILPTHLCTECCHAGHMHQHQVHACRMLLGRCQHVPLLWVRLPGSAHWVEMPMQQDSMQLTQTSSCAGKGPHVGK